MATERQRKAFKRWKAEATYRQRRQTTRLQTDEKSVTKYGEIDMSLYSDLLKLIQQNVTLEITIKVKVDETGVSVSYPAICEGCGWHKNYATADSASRALRAHQYHCSACASEDEMQWYKDRLKSK